MSTETPAKRGKKALNLATAQVADGSLAGPLSAYEICGNKFSRYTTTDITAYSQSLAAKNLIELQDHAYEVGVTPGRDRDTTVARLEQEFRRTNSRAPRTEGKQPDTDESIRRQAVEILKRGR